MHSSKQLYILWHLLGCCRTNWSMWRYHWGSHYNWWFWLQPQTVLLWQYSPCQTKCRPAAIWSLQGRVPAGARADGCSPILAIHWAPFRVVLEWIQYCFSEWLPARDKTSLGETVGKGRNMMLSCKISDCNLISIMYFICNLWENNVSIQNNVYSNYVSRFGIVFWLFVFLYQWKKTVIVILSVEKI